MARLPPLITLPLLTVFIVVQLSATADGLYGPSSPVVQLNPSNFKSKVTTYLFCLFSFSILVFAGKLTNFGKYFDGKSFYLFIYSFFNFLSLALAVEVLEIW